MKKIIKKQAFTFVELIVTAVIIWILWAIWFVASVDYLSDARNSQRISDLSSLKVAINDFKHSKQKLPIPKNYFAIKTWSLNIAWEGRLEQSVWLSTIDEIPYDPKIKVPYYYSITASKQEFQLAATLEWDEEKAIINWNYKSVAKTILPTLLLATWSEIDVSNSDNKKLFIFNNQSHNLPYSIELWDNPISDWTDFNTLLDEAEQSWNFSQNSDFSTCEEVKEALKDIWNWDYELRDEYWNLTSSWCTFN